MYDSPKRGGIMKAEFIAPASLLNDRDVETRAFGYKNYSIGPHFHEFYEMNIVLEGTGIHKIEKSSVYVKKGDVFMIPPNNVHAYNNTGGLEVYHILFSKKMINDNEEVAKKIPGFLQFVEIEPFLRQHISDDCFLHLSPSQLSEIKAEFHFIEDKGRFDTKELLPIKYHTSLKILYHLSFLFYEQLRYKEKNIQFKNNDDIIKLLEYIHLNYSKKITVEILCEISFFSRSSIFRYFKNTFGCTPMEYVNRYRCEKALEMLENNKFSKTYIAQCCGFYDLSHMERTIKHFKDHI